MYILFEFCRPVSGKLRAFPDDRYCGSYSFRIDILMATSARKRTSTVIIEIKIYIFYIPALDGTDACCVERPEKRVVPFHYGPASYWIMA